MNVRSNLGTCAGRRAFSDGDDPCDHGPCGGVWGLRGPTASSSGSAGAAGRLAPLPPAADTAARGGGANCAPPSLLASHASTTMGGFAAAAGLVAAWPLATGPPLWDLLGGGAREFQQRRSVAMWQGRTASPNAGVARLATRSAKPCPSRFCRRTSPASAVTASRGSTVAKPRSQRSTSAGCKLAIATAIHAGRTHSPATACAPRLP
mmetsp:Transcript_46754/g.105999  ORF Transcript_46754/g.105999 Transcript_46754/m.105999 type:complete len:207 (+) Transcript_46754:799-1419(+)